MKGKKFVYLLAMVLAIAFTGLASCNKKNDEKESVSISVYSIAESSVANSSSSAQENISDIIEEISSEILSTEEESSSVSSETSDSIEEVSSEFSSTEEESNSVSSETSDSIEEVSSEFSSIEEESSVSHQHNYLEIALSESTCTKQGQIRHECTGCDDFYIEYLPIAEHIPETIKGVTATCLREGISEGEKCEKCQKILKKQTPIAKIAHDYHGNSLVCHCCGLYHPDFLDYEKTSDGNGYICTGFQITEQLARRLLIPDTFDGLPVTEIKINKKDTRRFYNHVEIVSIEIGKNVTKISAAAFENCFNLIEVYDRSGISESNIESSILTRYALRVVKGEVENFTSWVYDRDGYLIYDEYGDEQGEQVFVGYIGKATKLSLPEGVTTINRRSFEACNTITSITLPSTLNFISLQAFADVTVLSSVYFTNPDGWYVCYAKDRPIVEWDEVMEDLKNPSVAFECLTQKYKLLNWKRFE